MISQINKLSGSQIILLVALIALSVIPTPRTALACSGGPPNSTLDTVLEKADYLVKGTLIQLDDALTNGILRADEYLIGGSGPAYMLLNRVSPVLSSVYVGHGYDTGCLYGGAGPLPLGLTGYWAVARQDDGSYAPVNYEDGPFYSPMWFALLQPSSTSLPGINVRVDPEGIDDWDNIHQVEFEDDEGFRDYIEAESGESPASPQRGPLPLFRPLLLTLDDGTHQMYPVDGGKNVTIDGIPKTEAWSAYDYPSLFETPLYCAEVGCQLNTSDRSTFAVQASSSEIEFGPYYSALPPQTVPGTMFQFSPNGEAFVVWYDSVMQVYMFQDALCDCLNFGSQNPALELIIEIPLSDETDFTSIRWSMDGTTFAYSDRTGLWLLDIFRQSEPQLLVTGETSIQPLSLFTSGRFVAFGNIEAWRVIDRLTGNTFDNGLLSPNEQHIVYMGDPDDYAVYERSSCALPISLQCFSVISQQELQSLTWVNDAQGVAAWCNSIDCGLSRIPTIYQDTWGNQVYRHGNQFPYIGKDARLTDLTYDALYGVFAVVQRIGRTQSQVLLYRESKAEGSYGSNDSIYRRVLFDDRITEITWMDSLFYTTTKR